MKNKILISSIVIFTHLTACKDFISDNSSNAEVKIVSAMKKVMWSGELQGKIDLDTISNKNGLYGIGPHSYLTGELMIFDGKSYYSKVTTDSTMSVKETFEVSAPFFVYTNVDEWNTVKVPSEIKNLADLESFVVEQSKAFDQPFVFKLTGKIENGTIHIQNLPVGTKVSSLKEAHQGQVNYELQAEEVEILGFFSKKHQGVFTHHDTFIHLHLLTKDRSKMGHLDDALLKKLTLYLPKK